MHPDLKCLLKINQPAVNALHQFIQLDSLGNELLEASLSCKKQSLTQQTLLNACTWAVEITSFISHTLSYTDETLTRNLTLLFNGKWSLLAMYE